MNVIIKTKNLELTAAFENLIQKRIAAVKKIASTFGESAAIVVEVERETRHHRKGDVFKAEAIVRLPGRKLVARAHGENLGTVITAMRNEFLKELKKYRGKKVEIPRRKYRKTKQEGTIENRPTD